MLKDELIERTDKTATPRYRMQMAGWQRFSQLQNASTKPAAEAAAAGVTAAQLLDTGYVRRQVERMRSTIETDPELAIGTAKEFLETVSQSILERAGVVLERKDDFPKLFKAALKLVQAVPADWEQVAGAADMITRLMAQLGAVADSYAELRNAYGTGHGKPASHRPLTPAHALLIVTVASAVGEFLATCPLRPRP